ncbi:MAG: phage baseplate assembly protein V [Candidatus Binataceae bacterium]
MKNTIRDRRLHEGRAAFRVALVKEIDPVAAKARVVFPDRDRAVSYWLPVLTRWSQNNKLYWMPDVNEQAICLMDEYDEAGCVLGTVFSQPDAPPPAMTADKLHMAFADGTHMEYDRALHLLDLAFNDGAEMKYDGAAHAFAVSLPPGAVYSVAANGASLSIDANGNVKVAAAGDITFKTGTNATSVDQVVSVFNTHLHPGVQPGGGETGKPTEEIP